MRRTSERAPTEGLFLHDTGRMGTQLGTRALRIAVKDAETTCRRIEILNRVLG